MSENAELKCYFSIFARLWSAKRRVLVSHPLDVKKDIKM